VAQVGPPPLRSSRHQTFPACTSRHKNHPQTPKNFPEGASDTPLQGLARRTKTRVRKSFSNIEGDITCAPTRKRARSAPLGVPALRGDSG
jgi:hypothetical protein